MDFLENSVLPQSSHHLELLRYLVVLAFLLLIPYLSSLFGTVLMSVIFNRKGIKRNNNFYLKFSKELIDMITFNKSVAFALGIIPFLSVIFSYTQLFHLTSTVILSGFILSFLFFLVAVIFIYVYKHSSHLQDLLNSVNSKSITSKTTGEDIANEAESYKSKTSVVYNKSGFWGVVFLLVAFYLLATSISSTFESGFWESQTFLGLIFSLHGFMNFLFYVGFSLLFTSAAILYYYFGFKRHKELNPDYVHFVKNYANTLGIISILVLPILIISNLIVMPTEALSGFAVWLALISILVLLIVAVLFYVSMKEGTCKFISLSFYLLVIFIGLSLFKDQFSFSTASLKQGKILEAEYVEYQNKLKESMGIALVQINGSDIYNGRCIACHLFDQKLTGPAYKNVLPKYEGKKGELVKFILNPVRVNNDFPPMPNQGLKPKEAEAVADYIMQAYKVQN